MLKIFRFAQNNEDLRENCLLVIYTVIIMVHTKISNKIFANYGIIMCMFMIVMHEWASSMVEVLQTLHMHNLEKKGFAIEYMHVL